MGDDSYRGCVTEFITPDKCKRYTGNVVSDHYPRASANKEKDNSLDRTKVYAKQRVT